MALMEIWGYGILVSYIICMIYGFVELVYYLRYFVTDDIHHWKSIKCRVFGSEEEDSVHLGFLVSFGPLIWPLMITIYSTVGLAYLLRFIIRNRKKQESTLLKRIQDLEEKVNEK